MSQVELGIDVEFWGERKEAASEPALVVVSQATPVVVAESAPIAAQPAPVEQSAAKVERRVWACAGA